jgi:dephospho-CoA kinase
MGKKSKKKFKLIKEERIAWEYIRRKYGKKVFKNGLVRRKYLQKEIDRLKLEGKKREQLLHGLIFLKYSRVKSTSE